MTRKYCLDTNVLIEPWNKYWSPELCPEYWEIIDELAKAGTIFCTHDVRREIEKVEDGLNDWVKARPYLIREVNEDVQKHVRNILVKYPRLVDTAKDRSMADPWVIAHAKAEGATVVTREIGVGLNGKKIKIPDVCADFGVEWIDDMAFVREIGIKFKASRG